MTVEIIMGDCRELLKAIPGDSLDSCVTDPPYHLTSIHKRFAKCGGASRQLPKKNHQYQRLSRGFMGQQWDGGDVAFDPATWAEVFRVLKPGAHLVAFSGTRTYHRMACAIEDAGFEIRDGLGDIVASDTHVRRFLASLDEEQQRAFAMCMEESQFGGLLGWVYGSGFPKSHDVAKAIDKMAGVEFEAKPAGGVGFMGPDGPGGWNPTKRQLSRVGDTTPEAAEWEGWGTALKPAWEPIVLARKPLAGTVAANVLQHGTGALNIDGCRVETEEGVDLGRNNNARESGTSYVVQREARRIDNSRGLGRWPANIIHDGSEEVLAGFPYSKSEGGDGYKNSMFCGGKPTGGHGLGDEGSAARFFYSAKADSAERHIGCEQLEKGNHHPTVKPIDLMRWLCRLVTPPGGTVLDPFAGSGSTLIAADREQFNAIGCELSPEYAEIARLRLSGDRGGLLDAMEAA